MNLKTRTNKFLINLLPKSIKRELRKPPPNAIVSYAQEGEDVLLSNIFVNKKNGFYVDVGAHHPTRTSVTYFFYLKGWRGINIDAMPGSMDEFNLIRPEDTNIECPVSDKSEDLTFYIFNEPLLNTFSEQEAKKKDGSFGFKIIDKKKMRTETLASILSKYLKEGQQVDFLSIDVEGFDLQVLKSIDWQKFKPGIILVEDLTQDFEWSVNHGAIKVFLKNNGYTLFAKTLKTLFFRLTPSESS